MLGLGGISSRGISGSPYSLVAIPLTMSAAVGITFGVAGNGGAYTPMAAVIGIDFGGTPRLFVNQAISATIGITFGGSAKLRIAGKPMVVRAVAQSFAVHAEKATYTVKVITQNYTVRGAK